MRGFEVGDFVADEPAVNFELHFAGPAGPDARPAGAGDAASGQHGSTCGGVLGRCIRAGRAATLELGFVGFGAGAGRCRGMSSERSIEFWRR